MNHDDAAREFAGIDDVLVSGQVVKSPDGPHTDVLPGQAITSRLG